MTVEYPIGHKRRRKEGIPLPLEKFKNSLFAHFTRAEAEKIQLLCEDREKLEEMTVNHFVDIVAIKSSRMSETKVYKPSSRRTSYLVSPSSRSNGIHGFISRPFYPALRKSGGLLNFGEDVFNFFNVKDLAALSSLEDESIGYITPYI